MNDKEHRNLERAGKADTDRILTIPNVLSFFRLALIPVIIVLYAKNEVWWAFGMLVLSGVTDVVDGWVARTYHMVSNFGKAIDPVADKLTQIAVLLCLMPMKCWWVVGILVLKEVSIGHHDAPDPAPHRHGLRRGLVRQAVHGRDLPFHVRPDALGGRRRTGSCMRMPRSAPA